MASGSIGTAWIQIKAQSKGIRSQIDKDLNAGSSDAGSKSGASFTSSFAGKIGRVAAITGKVFDGVTNVIAASFSDGIERASVLSNYTNVMSNLNIAEEDAQASIDKLSDKLTGLPTALDDAALSVQRFTSKNGDVGKSTDMFLALNNALIAGGASSVVQSQALEQISQAYAKGKPDLVEWRSIMQSMPAQATQIATAFGMSQEELGSALRRGEISMDDFMGKISELNTSGENGFKSFEEQAKNATNTLTTRITVLKQTVTKMIAGALNGEDISKFIDQLVERIIGVVPQLIGAFAKVTLGLLQAIPRVIPPLLQALLAMVPDLIKGVQQLLVSVVEMLPQLVPIITNALPPIIAALVDFLTNPEVILSIMHAGLALFKALIEAVPIIITQLIDALPDIIVNLVDVLTSPDYILMMIEGAVTLFMGIVEAVPKILKALLLAFGELFGKLWELMKERFGQFVATFGEFLGGIIKGALNGVLAFIENFINTPIRLLNKFIGLINSSFGFIGVNLGLVGEIKLPRLARGGLVEGIGTDMSDSNLVALSRGEYVIRASSARQIGYDNLDRLNETGSLNGSTIENYFTINGYNKSPEELAEIVSRKIALATKGVI